MTMKIRMMMSDPYGRKPRTESDPHEWHEFKFRMSIDKPVDWDNVDLRRWAQTISKYTALVMGKSGLSEEELASTEMIKATLMDLRVSRITLVTDDELHDMIDNFGDDETDTE